VRIYDKFYIGGEWVDPVHCKFRNVTNPATEEVCAQISMGSASDVDRAAQSARDAFVSCGSSSREERIDLLGSICDTYKKHYNDIADAIVEEMGAPKKLAIKAQAATGLGHFATALKILRDYEFEGSAGNSRVVKEPIGVCSLITPWNWPMNQIACKVAPAIAVGCTVILKPSEEAPLSAYILSRVMDEAGVPAGVFNMVNGDGPVVGAALSQHPLVDMVSFTGSTRAGVLVAQNAAPSVKRVAQELGGKSANIILDDADLARAVKVSVMSLFSNSGQSCNAPSRLLVPVQYMDEICALASEVTRKIVVGDPRAEDSMMGPLVNEAQFNKVQSFIQSGIDEGATLVCGGVGRPDGLERGYYVKPTIFANATNNMTIAREEIFGPVLTIIPYESDEQAIAIANDTAYGLAAYIQGKDMVRIKLIASKLRVGNVSINGITGDLSTPFGGFKQSGNGREWGAHGFDDFLETKAISGLV
jgi:aldehyde dehydrogenase (NAD+)